MNRLMGFCGGLVLVLFICLIMSIVPLMVVSGTLYCKLVVPIAAIGTLVMIVLYLASSIREVGPHEVGLISFLGSYENIPAGSGLVLVPPVISRLEKFPATHAFGTSDISVLLMAHDGPLGHGQSGTRVTLEVQIVANVINAIKYFAFVGSGNDIAQIVSMLQNKLSLELAVTKENAGFRDLNCLLCADAQKLTETVDQVLSKFGLSTQLLQFSGVIPSELVMNILENAAVIDLETEMTAKRAGAEIRGVGSAVAEITNELGEDKAKLVLVVTAMSRQQGPVFSHHHPMVDALNAAGINISSGRQQSSAMTPTQNGGTR